MLEAPRIDRNAARKLAWCAGTVRDILHGEVSRDLAADWHVEADGLALAGTESH